MSGIALLRSQTELIPGSTCRVNTTELATASDAPLFLSVYDCLCPL